MNKKIAITGGIGSGKSTVSQIISDIGYPVYSCDEIYATLIDDEQYISEIKNAFPTAVQKNRINREKLAQIVFNDDSARKKLNKIAHPLIIQSLLQQMNSEEGLVFAEVPLLFEGNFETLFNDVIVVKRNRQDRIESVCARDHKTKEEVIARMNAQFDYDTEKINAIVIENTGGLLALKNNVSDIIKQLM